MTDNLWLGRDPVIFLIRFTFHVLPFTALESDFFSILL